MSGIVPSVRNSSKTRKVGLGIYIRHQGVAGGHTSQCNVRQAAGNPKLISLQDGGPQRPPGGSTGLEVNMRPAQLGSLKSPL